MTTELCVLYSVLDEVELLELFRHGDEHAFEEIVLRNHEKVVNLCYRILGDQKDAEEAAQDVLMKVYRSVKTLKSTSAFSAWLYRIVLNTCNSKLRTLKYKLRKNFLLLDELFNIKQLSVLPSFKNDNELLIQEAINYLSKKKKVIVILYYIEGLSYNEIVDITKYKLGTIKSTLSRARQELADIIERIK